MYIRWSAYLNMHDERRLAELKTHYSESKTPLGSWYYVAVQRNVQEV